MKRAQLISKSILSMVFEEIWVRKKKEFNSFFVWWKQLYILLISVKKLH